MSYEIRTLRSKRDTLLREMQVLSLGKLDSESRAKFDRMNRDCMMLDAELNESEQRQAVVRSNRGPVGQSIERDTDTVRQTSSVRSVPLNATSGSGKLATSQQQAQGSTAPRSCRRLSTTFLPML